MLGETEEWVSCGVLENFLKRKEVESTKEERRNALRVPPRPT